MVVCELERGVQPERRVDRVGAAGPAELNLFSFVVLAVLEERTDVVRADLGPVPARVVECSGLASRRTPAVLDERLARTAAVRAQPAVLAYGGPVWTKTPDTEPRGDARPLARAAYVLVPAQIRRVVQIDQPAARGPTLPVRVREAARARLLTLLV